MEQKTFYEIIAFAIDREREAVQFYHELQDIVQFAPRRELLRELEDMEKGHIKMLEGIRDGKTQIRDIPQIANLHLSEYLVPAKPTAQMSYQDIILTAMKREETSLRLYTDLANLSADPTAKQLFQRLAAEEAKHKLHFEKIYEDEILSDN
ncbi:MAG: ferritin family protein [Desulfobacterota bacterium]|nr:ferritin family protein [Thermodesulfobacteriota bacterium]